MSAMVGHLRSSWKYGIPKIRPAETAEAPECLVKEGHDWKTRCQNCGWVLMANPVDRLIASTPVPIISMCIFKDRLFVATSEGVFERGDDGVFHECRLVKAEQKDA